MKIKIQIKSWYLGTVLFEYESENNTIKETLRNAVLSGAVLINADLRNADLRNADLTGADLRNAIGYELALARTRILPEGDLIGYKKCRDGIIVKLKIPSEAKRSHAFGRKCRAEFADPIEIYDAEIAYSTEDKDFSYEVGKRVYPTKPFDEDCMNECSTGIHFFITKIEAENY